MAGYHSCMNRGRGYGGNRSSREMWEIEISHNGLNKYRHIRGSDKDIVEQKADYQLAKWNEMWERKIEAQEKKDAKDREKIGKELKKSQAELETIIAQSKTDELKNILEHTLSINDAIDWKDLMQSAAYKVKKPKKHVEIKKPKPDKHPEYIKSRKPTINDTEYRVNLNILDMIFKSRKIKKEEKIKEGFYCDIQSWNKKIKIEEDQWNKECKLIDINNKSTLDNWRSKSSESIKKHEKDISEWERKRDLFKNIINNKNNKIKEKKKLYESGDEGAVIDYCDMVLSNSEYPEYFPQNWLIEFNSEEKILVIDYDVINNDELPNIKEIKYIATRDEFSEKCYSNKFMNDLYDLVVYQIAIRTIHEIFESDVINAIYSVVFNGRVEAINKATGRNANYCIVSVQAEKDEFMALNLENIEPKECFKLLKGISGTKLSSITPVAPIISIDYKDDRIAEHYDVAHKLDEKLNLAAMDWQDFENLIREVFEKEFSVNGGVVKVTQASRDGGVDAIAFDPDPIRGGKIVIQAKRYTNVVGVSAVRDLYGTTLNEGATKGILVTTSNYGPDAYKFCKDKPLTLLNGSHLLHLLEKHGHKAKIDIKEAKKILSN